MLELTLHNKKKQFELMCHVSRVNKKGDLSEVLDQYFHHDVLELNVHHGGHSLLLRAHQRRSEDDAQVGYGHQVELVLCGNSAGRGNGCCDAVLS